jgi:archaellum component FlaG (FlaF/FlaG flagellin family)
VLGVLLIRLSSRSVDELAAAVSSRANQIVDRIEGNFVVISDQGTRITRLPNSD